MIHLPRIVTRVIVALTTIMTSAVPALAQQKGKASYYSKRANGARTSSGIRLNNDSLVCAHKTHPFGTKLLVKNPANGKEVVVTVIDRGPHIRGRIIDLSHEAARRLGILAAGVAMVEVSLYSEKPVPLQPEPYEAPEIDLELPANGVGGMTPDWQKDRQEQKTTQNNK
ncbi:MAG: septal ring lytic transglycosylase RlpA family protein [Prevotella sp.]|nr:septal ring lytic transglycosylase RlpA family protein [Prevotella sp.]